MALARAVISRALWIARPRVPLAAVRPRIERKVQRALADPVVMEDARKHMEHLLGAIGRTDQVEAASRGYVEHWTWCEELRWHPRSVTRQRVEGIEHLRAAHALGRGVVLSFVHHAHFDGVFGSVGRLGIPIQTVAGAREMSIGGASPSLRQHLRVVAKGGGLVSAGVGTAGIVEELRKGRVIASAIDVPGGSLTTMAGRAVKCSSGPARAAFLAGAPVVLLTSHRGTDGTSYVQLHEALMPAEFASADELLEAMVRRHEGPLLEWPEVAYLPTVCWWPAEPAG